MSTSLTAVESQSNDDKRFIACNDKHCSTTYKYLDWVVHTKVDGPDPRDHFANERNFLSWLRVGMTLALIGNPQLDMLSTRPILLTCAYACIIPGYMTLIDLRGEKSLAPSNSLPWNHEEPTPYKTRYRHLCAGSSTSSNHAVFRIVAFIMIALGFSSLCTSVVIYFKNQRRIVHRLLDVGHGWAGYTMALLIMLFICFIMVVALTELN